MKHLLACVLVLGFWTMTEAQTEYKPVVTEQQASVSRAETSYPIAGSPRLNADWERIRPVLEAYTQSHPQQLQKTIGPWNFTVGQTHAWWATDQSTSSQFEYQVPSTCKAVGAYCYIFVEDALWTNDRVDQGAVDAVKNAFDSRTPADSTKGIYQLDTQYFGNPPDVDNDPGIIILILDIKDGYNGSGSYEAGYFYSLNEYSEAAAQQSGSNRHSNQAEIYYIDGNPTNLKTSYGVTLASSTTAHEFQHMIHWKYDSHEKTFVNEGLSEAAMALCGYTFENPKYYYSNTNLSFLSWGTTTNVLQDYSRAGLFTWYLIEQFGSDIAKKIVQSTATDIAGYNDALSQMGTSKTFDDVLKSFAVANAIDDKSADSRYGFTLPITAQITPAQTYLDPNVSGQSQSIETRGTVYLLYKGGKNLSATFTSQSPTISVRPIATGSGVNKVTDISLSSLYTEPGFGTSYDQVIFAVTNLGTAAASFSYSSSGQAPALTVQELAFEDGVPDGYLSLTAPDTAVVWFDALPGAVLDSIKVAFRKNGSIGFGIWKCTGVQRPTPLGSNYGFTTMNVTGSPTFSFPYPVPYPNWRKVDVSSWNVDLSSSFAVGFVFGTDGTAPGLMESSEPYAQPHHSYTYTTAWYNLTNAAGDSAYKYVVRAYVHFGTVGVTQPIELVPSTFTLGNNYPNPFNPSTTIRYNIPVTGYVRLRVFDVAGREVASLVNGVQSAGSYVVNWHGTDDAGRSLASGVYFYTLESLGQQITRRMVLLK
ncbi:MAG: T9SS type A sorting domain-containing protein [Ignavibacteriales bacterium]|nr:T9SS type A sorting domain-containing protein [Ignavibacteriales bacterium]